ncbi:MAG: hypothetical protein IJF11_05670 [Clostridia bacterium]|nr:hypothetical protein [Clostridia bacterium]
MRKIMILILAVILNLSPIVKDNRTSQTDTFDDSEYLYYKTVHTEAEIPFGFYEPQLIENREQLESFLETAQETSSYYRVAEDFFDYNYIIVISYGKAGPGTIGYRGVEVADGKCTVTVETVASRKAYLENGEICFDASDGEKAYAKCDLVYVFKTESNTPEQFDSISINQIHHRAIKRHYE